MPYFIRDHLGSVRAIVDGSTGDVLETSDYLPFGKRWELTGGQAAQTVTDPTNRWRFSGKETQSFYNHAIPYNDFGARLHDPRTGRWLGVDPLAEKDYEYTPWGYCHSCPLNRIEIDGRWDIKVSASSNRDKNNYGVLTAYTNKGEPFFSTIVKVHGQGRDRMKTYGDTPTGTYKILGWRKTGEGTGYSKEMYGDNYLLALDYETGEAAGKRQGMHLHAGRKRQNSLADTYGCIRINEEDIMELKELSQWLESSDETESKGSLTVENDLEAPVSYSDREETKNSISYNGGELSPAVVSARQHSPLWGSFTYQ